MFRTRVRALSQRQGANHLARLVNWAILLLHFSSVKLFSFSPLLFALMRRCQITIPPFTPST